MRIWYISKYASPSKYHFGTRHFYISEEWAKMGIDVTVITSNSSHLAKNLPIFNTKVFIENINQVKTVWINTVKNNKSSGFKRVLSWFDFDFKLLFVKKFGLSKPDVIIVSSLSLTTVLPAFILSYFYKSKLVFEVRDIWPMSLLVLGKVSKFNPFFIYLSWLEKFGYRISDLIVGTMPNLIQHVRDNNKIQTRCICIPQGVNLHFYKSQQEDLDSSFIKQYIPRDKFIVCYAGTLNVNNPLNSLIKAAKLLSHVKNIHFIILGNGDLKQKYQNETKDLDNITFPPTIHKNQVNAFLRNVSLCYDAFDSELSKYGLSRNKWIDYMYAAKPIICSFDGYQSMINESNSGVFVPFDDYERLAEKIFELSNYSPEALKAMGNRGKEFLIKNRTFDILARQYLDEIYMLFDDNLMSA